MLKRFTTEWSCFNSPASELLFHPIPVGFLPALWEEVSCARFSIFWWWKFLFLWCIGNAHFDWTSFLIKVYNLSFTSPCKIFWLVIIRVAQRKQQSICQYYIFPPSPPFSTLKKKTLSFIYCWCWYLEVWPFFQGTLNTQMSSSPSLTEILRSKYYLMKYICYIHASLHILLFSWISDGAWPMKNINHPSRKRLSFSPYLHSCDQQSFLNRRSLSLRKQCSL